MKTEIETALKALIEKAKTAPAHEALHYTQSALNLAQAQATIANTEKHLK